MPTFTGYEPKNFVGKGPSGSMQQPVESHNLTGYEPNNLIGKGPGNAPIATSASRTASTQQLVPAGTPADDLSNLFETEMSSLLEDMFEEPLDPPRRRFCFAERAEGSRNFTWSTY